jgi:hypothetical protein
MKPIQSKDMRDGVNNIKANMLCVSEYLLTMVNNRMKQKQE